MARALTAKQEAFARAVADGATQTEAYRKAYDAGGMSAGTIAVKASKLANQDKVRERVAQHRKDLADREIWSRARALTLLVEIAEEARSNTSERSLSGGEELLRYNTAAQNVAIKAIEQANKMCGYHEPERVEHSGHLTVELGGELMRWAK